MHTTPVERRRSESRGSSPVAAVARCASSWATPGAAATSQAPAALLLLAIRTIFLFRARDAIRPPGTGTTASRGCTPASLARLGDVPSRTEAHPPEAGRGRATDSLEPETGQWSTANRWARINRRRCAHHGTGCSLRRFGAPPPAGGVLTRVLLLPREQVLTPAFAQGRLESQRGATKTRIVYGAAAVQAGLHTHAHERLH